MASGPITSWQIEGDKVEALTDFNFLVYKITADSDSICDIKMRLFLGKPRQHMKKQRHHFATTVHIVKAMVFPVVTYGCQSWTIKKAEC